MDKNRDIRKLIARKRLRQYEVADQLGVSEFTLSRWLRCELTPERRQKVLDAIDQAVKALEVQ